MTARIVALSVFAFTALRSSVSLAEIRPENCARAARYSESKRGVAVLVIQNDRTVFESYANGEVRDGRWPIFSGTKSFWGVAALCAVRDGLIKLDERVADTITEWKNPAEAGLKSQITIRQLLNQTDGIDGASWLHRQSIADRNAMAIRLSVLAPPSARFIYGPSHLQIFSELLRRKLSGRSTVSYIQENVLSPLGLTNLEFKRDARGNPLPASGFELTASEWARFGEMIIGRGNYNGRQIVPATLLEEAFTGSSANPSYGLTFWLNRDASSFFAREIDIEKELDLPWQRARWGQVCVCRAAPADMVVALGSAYQRLFLIPSMNAVIVRQGRDAKFSDAYFLRLILGR
jgi:CubicO group peptidase (beta-lactamase class C family)